MAVTPFDAETEYRLELSETPVTVDGYAQGEPMRLVCSECGAAVELDADPDTPGVDELPHHTGCSQRWARSEWWRSHLD